MQKIVGAKAVKIGAATQRKNEITKLHAGARYKKY
jgi:hypothetical protein